MLEAERLAEGTPLLAAAVPLDLAAIYAAQGDHERVEELAEDALSILRAGRLEQRALAAFQVLYTAAQAEEATAELAVRVADFVVQSTHDKRLRFEG